MVLSQMKFYARLREILKNLEMSASLQPPTIKHHLVISSILSHSVVSESLQPREL